MHDLCCMILNFLKLLFCFPRTLGRKKYDIYLRQQFEMGSVYKTIPFGNERSLCLVSETLFSTLIWIDLDPVEPVCERRSVLVWIWFKFLVLLSFLIIYLFSRLKAELFWPFSEIRWPWFFNQFNFWPWMINHTV